MSDTHTEKPIIERPNAERDFEPGASLFVWTVWTITFVAVIVYVASFTVNIPIADEWSNVPVITGERPLTLSWLWEQHNEHRLALPKLIWLLSLRLSHYNFRLLPLLDICALAALAFAMILEVKKLRGWLAYTDAFFPLLILNPAQFENLLSAWQVGFVLPVVITGALLLLIIQNIQGGGLQILRRPVLACVCLILLPFCGGVGLAFGAALSLCFGYLAFSLLRTAQSMDRRRGWSFLAAGGFVVVVTFFSRQGLRCPPQIPPSPDVRASLTTSLQVLGGSFGVNASRLERPILGLVALVLLGTGIASSVLA